MTDNRSYKIYLVVKFGHEFEEPVRAYTRKRKAQRVAENLAAKEENWHIVLGYKVQQIDLVTPDGAHALHQDLIAAVGKNK